MNDAASAAPSDAELFPLIEKHFGMVPRRDDTVIAPPGTLGSDLGVKTVPDNTANA